MHDNPMAILIISCDKYSDLWIPFVKLFYTFWADCPYDVYLGTNYMVYKDSRIKTICIGEDKSWTENVRLMLDKISNEYVLVLLEDFFLEQKVDSELIKDVVEYQIKNNIDCLRLCPNPPPFEIEWRKYLVGKVAKNAPYFISTQPSIWKKSVLLTLLNQGYSAWDFEKKNSIDSRYKNLRIYSSKKFLIKRHNGVERGKYYTSTIKLLKDNGIDVESSNRGVINDFTLFRRIYSIIYSLYCWLLSKRR